MGDIIPYAKTYYIKCYRCKTIYKTEKVYYGTMGRRLVEACPICKYSCNEIGFGDESISALHYWIIKLWRIFWHGRIDIRKEDNNG